MTGLSNALDRRLMLSAASVMAAGLARFEPGVTAQSGRDRDVGQDAQALAQRDRPFEAREIDCEPEQHRRPEAGLERGGAIGERDLVVHQPAYVAAELQPAAGGEDQQPE